MNAYIISGFRSAVGKAPRGQFRFTRPDDLAARVVQHLMARTPKNTPSPSAHPNHVTLSTKPHL